VFSLFGQLGTVHAALRFLVEHQVQIGMRERSGPGKGEAVWRAPHQQGLVNMLGIRRMQGSSLTGAAAPTRPGGCPGTSTPAGCAAPRPGSSWVASRARRRLISAPGSTSATWRGWPPTGRWRRARARRAKARRCWAGWWSAESAVIACR
jgi:hypothetical protein